jgi:hypothetical protein
MSGNGVRRRTVLQSVGGVAALQAGLVSPLVAQAQAAIKTGAGMGDFDFLAGSWKISHRQQKTDKSWDAFEGEATVFRVLEGLASIEELRIPARKFSGMGVRVYDVDKKLWADHWVSSRNGVVNPPMYGSFQDNVGTFIADETDGGTPIKSRGVWDQITPTHCRWRQGVSSDGGKTWTDTWFMDWNRAGAA